MRSKRTSVDASYLRKYNQRLILDAVYEKETTSRVELSKILHLSKPAISDNLSELLELGIVEEIGEGTVAEKGGRKPLLLKFNQNHKYIVIIDLNYSNPVVVLGNLKNEIMNELDIRVAKNASPDQYVTVIENGIDSLLSSSGYEPKDIFCIAVSSPGVFDAEGNILSQNPGYGRILWHESNLRGALQNKFNMNIIVKNDIKAATLGEWTYGAGHGEENLLYLSCGVGLGAGIVLNSKLYEGRHFNAGEIYYYLDMSKPELAGTLEDRICMKQLIEGCVADIQAGVETCLKDCTDPIGFKDIEIAYQKKDPYVCSKVKQICDVLCTLMFNLGNFLALDKVIFGGEYAVFGETLLTEYVNRFIPCLSNGVNIELAALGKYSGIHGMLFTAREAYLNYICNTSISEE